MLADLELLGELAFLDAELFRALLAECFGYGLWALDVEERGLIHGLVVGKKFLFRVVEMVGK